MGLMFGDNSRHGWKFGNLMPAYFAISWPWFAGQRFATPLADRGNVGNQLIDATSGQANAMMATVPILAASFATRRQLRNRPGGVERIG